MSFGEERIGGVVEKVRRCLGVRRRVRERSIGLNDWRKN